MVGIPIRSCVACRRREEQQRLVRLVVAGGEIRVDPEARRPGRGAYVCDRQDCLRAVLRRGAAPLARALRVRPDAVTLEEKAISAAWQARWSDE